MLVDAVYKNLIASLFGDVEQEHICECEECLPRLRNIQK